MGVWNVVRKSVRYMLMGVTGFFCSLVGIMGYYPLIPAFFTANYLLSDKTLFLYVGLLAGMGYFLPLAAMVKYTFSLIIIAVAIRFYIWANRTCSCLTAGTIAGLILVVMNLSGQLFVMESGPQLVLGASEGLMTVGFTMAIYYGITVLAELVNLSANTFQKEEVVAELSVGRQEERAAAFATAVDGLSAAFSTMQRVKEKTPAEHVGLLEQEITGKLCAACDGSAVCWSGHKTDLSVKIRQMLQAVIAHQPREEIVGRAYVTTCPRYSYMVEEAIAAFGRMELNQAWYRRLLENRMAIAGQLDAIADLMTEWSKPDKNIDRSNRMLISKMLFEIKERGLVADELHLYEDSEKRKYIQANVASKWGGGILCRKYVQALEKALGKPLRIEQGAKSILTKDPVWLTVYEDTSFYAMAGIATHKKTSSTVSGDSFSVFTMENGRHYACLSDGMGSGSRASQESELVVDLLQKFMEAGFHEKIAIRMMNSAMVLQGEDNAYSTLDLARINLYNGELELYKIGAAASFIRRGEDTEYISSESLPAGAKLEPEPEIVQRTLCDGDFLVMVSDGVLEYLHVENPEQTFAEIVSDICTDNASVLAQQALEKVLLITDGYAMDDMTILVTGIWEK